MADPSSLYPQPPQQQQNGALSGDPLRLIGALQGIQGLRLQAQQFPALAQQPAAALAGQNIANTTAQQQQESAASTTVRAALATALAGNPNPTEDDVHSATAYVARSIPSIGVSRPDLINAANDYLLKDGPKGIVKNRDAMLNMGMSPSEATARVQGPPAPGGAPQTVTKATATASGTFPTDLPPGGADYLTASAKAATDLEGTALTSPDNRANLTNLQQDLRVLGTKTGPMLQTEKHVNTVLSRFGANVTMSSDELAAADAADKIANQISTQQSKAMGGNTDQGRAMVLGSTPNTSMSAFGNENMSAMLLGNQDAIDTQRREWMKDKKAQGLPQNGFLDWQQNTFFPKANPRVFQFERLPHPAQNKFIAQMTPEEAQGFDSDYQAAVKRGWIKGAANAAQ